MSDELVAQIAKRFIQRRDIKAVQWVRRDDGKVMYSPDREMKNLGMHGPMGFGMDHLRNHLSGSATYGHYLLDSNDNCRMFCYDIDLIATDENTTGFWVPDVPLVEGMSEAQWNQMHIPQAFDPRVAWTDRAHPGRAFIKTQMGMLARKLVGAIQQHVGLECTAAYSGSKGIHVYGFWKDPGVNGAPAADVREIAHYVLDATGDWELYKGNNFYRYKLQDPYLGYPNFDLEVYPKQDSLEGKDLGNLLRLPLGKNLKSPSDPTFFMNLNTPVGTMAPHPDPVKLLMSGDPYC